MKTLMKITDLLAEILAADPYGMDAAFALTPESVAPIDVARLAIACEDAFGISLHDEAVAQWHTVGDACAHVEALLEAGMGEKAERTDAERVGWFYE